jgi:hypothetical protein
MTLAATECAIGPTRSLTRLQGVALYSVAGLLLVGLVLVATAGTAGVVLAVVAAVGLLALVALGPERLGSVFMLGALFAAPMNNVHAGGPGFVTLTDVCLVAGMILLLPRLLVGRPHLPRIYKTGIILMFISGLLTSIVTAEGILSLFFFVRLVIATMVLPLAIAMWQPDVRWLRALAWAYIVGQMVSDGWGILKQGFITGDGRAIGLTEHPNYFALGGQMALALLIYLWYQTPRQWKWTLFVAGAVCAHSVYTSGSRASLVCTLMLLVLWPVIERNAVGWGFLLAGGLLVLTFGTVLLNSAAPGSALYRLKGGGSAGGSDQAREMQIQVGIHRFWTHPFFGNGFSNIFDIHNVYLQMAVAGGVLALFAFIFMMFGVMQPILSNPPNRLAYAGISYAAIAMLGPVMWDRVVWAPLALMFAASATQTLRGPHRNHDLSVPTHPTDPVLEPTT